MVLTSLHAESDAATNPPSIFAPLTLSNYVAVFERGVGSFLINSATASIVSTLLVLLLLSLLNYVLRVLRWHRLATRIGVGVPLSRTMLYYIAGFSMTATPGRVIQNPLHSRIQHDERAFDQASSPGPSRGP